MLSKKDISFRMVSNFIVNLYDSHLEFYLDNMTNAQQSRVS